MTELPHKGQNLLFHRIAIQVEAYYQRLHIAYCLCEFAIFYDRSCLAEIIDYSLPSMNAAPLANLEGNHQTGKYRSR